MHSIKNVEVDVIDYTGEECFQCVLEFVSEKEAKIHVRKIDTTEKTQGWSENLFIFMNDDNGNVKKIHVGAMEKSHQKTLTGITLDGCVFEKSEELVDAKWISSYNAYKQFEHYPLYINRETFNAKFSTDIVVLPSSMWALGLKDGGCYIYHDSHHLTQTWSYESKYTIDFILSMVFRMPKLPSEFYCITSALDGHLEGIYYTEPQRSIAARVGDVCCRSRVGVDMSCFNEREYPVFHKQKYILAMSTRKDVPFSIPVVDRYYLQLNRYNLYRSIHKGMRFSRKLSKMVYAAGPRGSKFNFTNRRDIDLDQRSFFATDKVDKTNVDTGSISREKQVTYKYIIDIDGNAATWDATAWKLNSGSVIFKTDSYWKQWFYDKFIAWEHFVPIKDDFSDLQEKYYWCEENQEKCEEIIRNAKHLFHDVYRHDNVEKYMSDVIFQLTDLQKQNK
jgi:hypothetical protein